MFDVYNSLLICSISWLYCIQTELKIRYDNLLCIKVFVCNKKTSKTEEIENTYLLLSSNDTVPK